MRQQLLLLIGCNEHVLVMRDTYGKQSNRSLSRKQICSLVWLCSIRMRTFRTQASQPACQSRWLTSLSLPIALDDNCIGHRIGMSRADTYTTPEMAWSQARVHINLNSVARPFRGLLCKEGVFCPIQVADACTWECFVCESSIHSGCAHE